MGVECMNNERGRERAPRSMCYYCDALTRTDVRNTVVGSMLRDGVSGTLFAYYGGSVWQTDEICGSQFRALLCLLHQRH